MMVGRRGGGGYKGRERGKGKERSATGRESGGIAVEMEQRKNGRRKGDRPALRTIRQILYIATKSSFVFAAHRYRLLVPPFAL